LQSTSNAVVKGGIGVGNTIMSRGFGTGIRRSGERITVEHIGTVKNFKGILLLRQEYAQGIAMHINPEKVMKIT
jgi:hypothetical protein